MSGGSEFQSLGAERLKGGSEGAGGGGSVKEVRQVGRGKVVDGFKGMKENFEVDTEVDWKPVELF